MSESIEPRRRQQFHRPSTNYRQQTPFIKFPFISLPPCPKYAHIILVYVSLPCKFYQDWHSKGVEMGNQKDEERLGYADQSSHHRFKSQHADTQPARQGYKEIFIGEQSQEPCPPVVALLIRRMFVYILAELFPKPMIYDTPRTVPHFSPHFLQSLLHCVQSLAL